MIRGSDGLDYEDLAARLKNEPTYTPRSAYILELRRPPNDPRAAGLFIHIYDGEYQALTQAHGHDAAHMSAMTMAKGAVKRLHHLNDIGYLGDALAAAADPGIYFMVMKQARSAVDVAAIAA